MTLAAAQMSTARTWSPARSYEITETSSGIQANSHTFGYNGVQMTPDGRYFSFYTDASNLASGDTDGSLDLFWKDTVTGRILRLAAPGVASEGLHGGSMSSDGRYVLYDSPASSVVAGDTNGASDIFRFDTLTGTTQRVSTTSSGAQANGASNSSQISPDGRYVKFLSYATNLVSGDTNGVADWFVKDTVTGAITLAKDAPAAPAVFHYELIYVGQDLIWRDTQTNQSLVLYTAQVVGNSKLGPIYNAPYQVSMGGSDGKFITFSTFTYIGSSATGLAIGRPGQSDDVSAPVANVASGYSSDGPNVGFVNSPSDWQQGGEPTRAQAIQDVANPARTTTSPWAGSSYALDLSPPNAALSAAAANILRTYAQGGANAGIAYTLSDRVASGAITHTQAIQEIVKAAAATTSVATLSYEFFTGKLPFDTGLDYLVAKNGYNVNNVSGPYYQSFSLENRYINFAVNLGKFGDGKTAFTAAYGTKSLFEATKSAYATIFGKAPTDATVHALLDPTFVVNGQTLTRADYFAYYGQDGANGIGTKAAMVGWLLSEAVKADIGMYAKANDAFLTDLADGRHPGRRPHRRLWKARIQLSRIAPSSRPRESRCRTQCRVPDPNRSPCTHCAWATRHMGPRAASSIQPVTKALSPPGASTSPRSRNSER